MKYAFSGRYDGLWQRKGVEGQVATNSYSVKSKSMNVFFGATIFAQSHETSTESRDMFQMCIINPFKNYLYETIIKSNSNQREWKYNAYLKFFLVGGFRRAVFTNEKINRSFGFNVCFTA